MSVENEGNESIRHCRAEDLPAVIGLLEQLGEASGGAPGFDLAHVGRLFEEMSHAPGIYLNFVYEIEGEVVGFLSMVFYRTLYHQGGTALINELVVDRCWRGQGVGGQLVRRAAAEARARGMDELEVGTEQENQPAQAFYRRAGFDEEYVLFGMEF